MNVDSTQEAKQKLVDFYLCKGSDMLKFACTLPNLANKCPHKLQRATYLLENIREGLVGGPPFAFTRKTFVDETFVRNSADLCKNFVGIDASKLYPLSMCQAMPTGPYTRWNRDSKPGKIKPRGNKTRSFENMVLFDFQRVGPQCKVEFLYDGYHKKTDAYNVDDFCGHCNTVLEAMGCYYHYCPCQEARPALIEEKI